MTTSSLTHTTLSYPPPTPATEPHSAPRTGQIKSILSVSPAESKTPAGRRDVVSVLRRDLEACWPPTMTISEGGPWDKNDEGVRVGVVVLPNDAEARHLTDPVSLELLLIGRPKPAGGPLGPPQVQLLQHQEQLRCLLRLSRVRGFGFSGPLFLVRAFVCVALEKRECHASYVSFSF